MTKGSFAIFIAAIASAVTSAAFQLSTVVWPDWIKHHTPVVIGLCVLSAVLWAWWLVLRYGPRLLSPAPERTPGQNAPSASLTAPISIAPVFNIGSIGHSSTSTKASESTAPQEANLPAPPPAPPTKLHINFAEYSAVDGSGEKYNVTDCLRYLVSNDGLTFDIENHSFQAGGRNFVPKDPKPGVKKKLRVSYSFDGGPLQTIEQLEGSRLELPESSLRPRLVIRREWRDVIYDLCPGQWRFPHPYEVEGSQMLLLWIENPYPQTKGERGTHFPELIAHVKIQHYGTIQIRRAYWLEHTNNKVEIPSGSEHAIVVGQFKNDDFVIYENPYPDDSYTAFDVPCRPLGRSRNIRVSNRDGAIIDIDISIVDSASNEVIERRRIKIHMPQRITQMVD